MRLAFALVLGLLPAPTAFASGYPAMRVDAAPAENRYNPYTARLPGCDDPAVLGELTSWFNSREATYWGPLQVVGYDHVRPIAFRPWGPDFIPRRFCTARITLNDARVRRVDYSIREGLGLWGWTWNVNWCVVGLDRHRSYAPECKMARP